MTDNIGKLTTCPDGGSGGSSPGRDGGKNSWITHGSLAGAIWRLALPMIGAALLQDLFSIVDLIFVGKLGPVAISAVTLSGVVMGVLHMLVMGVTTGCTALVAHAVGAGNRKRAEMVASQGLLLAVILSLGTAATMPLAALCLKVLGGTPEVVAEGTSYLQITLLGSFTMFLSITFAAALRGAGDAITPLKIVGLGNLINIVLDPILIFGWFGVPALGVAGSAWATVAARLIVTMLLAKVFFMDGHEHFHLNVRDIKPHGKTIWQMFRIGVFGSGQMLMRNISGLALIRIVAIFGTIPVAAFGISFRLMVAAMMPAMGVGVAASTLVGQCMGARKVGRAVRAAWLAAGANTVFAIVVGIAFIVFAEPLIAAFN
ncbi:MAG: MATE family efflux transporter, partial [Phycisphaerae bacterium]|nr:MATE family efflux transporter [Phycisphaerae bacterium]